MAKPAPFADFLGKEHCDCLNRVLESVPNALELAKCAKECGWPADEFIRQLEAQREQATKAKALLFPGAP